MKTKHCSICGRPARIRGLCNTHYVQYHEVSTEQVRALIPALVRKYEIHFTADLEMHMKPRRGRSAVWSFGGELPWWFDELREFTFKLSDNFESVGTWEIDREVAKFEVKPGTEAKLFGNGVPAKAVRRTTGELDVTFEANPAQIDLLSQGRSDGAPKPSKLACEICGLVGICTEHGIYTQETWAQKLNDALAPVTVQRLPGGMFKLLAHIDGVFWESHEFRTLPLWVFYVTRAAWNAVVNQDYPRGVYAGTNHESYSATEFEAVLQLAGTGAPNAHSSRTSGRYFATFPQGFFEKSVDFAPGGVHLKVLTLKELVRLKDMIEYEQFERTDIQ